MADPKFEITKPIRARNHTTNQRSGVSPGPLKFCSALLFSVSMMASPVIKLDIGPPTMTNNEKVRFINNNEGLTIFQFPNQVAGNPHFIVDGIRRSPAVAATTPHTENSSYYLDGNVKPSLVEVNLLARTKTFKGFWYLFDYPVELEVQYDIVDDQGRTSPRPSRDV